MFTIWSWIWCRNNFVIVQLGKLRYTCGVEMLDVGVALGIEFAGGLSLEPRARFISCVWQTAPEFAAWLWILEVVLVDCNVCGELAVVTLFRLLVLLYLVPPRGSPVTSTSILSKIYKRNMLKNKRFYLKCYFKSFKKVLKGKKILRDEAIYIMDVYIFFFLKQNIIKYNKI